MLLPLELFRIESNWNNLTRSFIGRSVYENMYQIIFLFTITLKKSEKLRGSYPANIYLHKVNKRNAIKRCEICLKLNTFF